MNLIESSIKKWDRAAIVRSRPRRIINDKDKQASLFFPLERLPLCMHPYISNLGNETLRYIQVQNLYHYLNGIANIELDIINESSHKLYKNKIGIIFPEEMCLEALTVVVDESYHALVALDLINQVEQMTGITPTVMPEETEASYALDIALSHTPDHMKEIVRLVCVSLSEQALTTDLIDIINNENIFPSFYHVMKDHVSDEGRHARFSQRVLKHIWTHSDDQTKELMKKPLMNFIEHYSTNKINKSITYTILEQLNIEKNNIDEIINDTYPEVLVKPWETNNIVTQQMLVALEKSGILSDLPLNIK